MIRRKRDPDSSLFPFLSVLACVIGTLTLLIAALAIGQVAESLERAELDPEQIEQLAADRAALAGVREHIADTERLGEELAAARAELRGLGVDPTLRASERRRAVRTRTAAARLARRLRELERRDAELRGSIRGVETALDEERPDDGNRPIRILPQGDDQPALRPFFIECRAEGVRIYSDDFATSEFLDRGRFEDASRLAAFLERARRVREGTVVFLIRPDGVETYRWASGRADGINVRHAKLPLPSQGPLEFRL